MEENPAKKSPNGTHQSQPRQITTTITTTLPDNIVLEEILPRLPVKSLCRFKCVSKHFLFTISKSPDFAKLHLNFLSLSRRHFFGISPPTKPSKSCKFYLLPYKERTTKNEMIELGRGDDVDRTDLVDSCNGLVCLYYRDDDTKSMITKGDLYLDRVCYFTLWNPAIHQSRVIKCPRGVHMASSYGFGYVPSLDDYKIVASLATEWEGLRKFYGFYVFSLRTGEWKRVVRSSEWGRITDRSEKEKKMEKIVIKLKRAGLMIGDTVYWSPSKYKTKRRFVGFDVVREKFKRYSRLDWQVEYYELVLFRLKGCLALRGNGAHNVCDFWMLKDVDDWNSWQKLFFVDQTKATFLTISETGKCLVQEPQQFKLVDLSEEALECVEKNKCRPLMKKTVDHIDTLVSPFEMTETTGHFSSNRQILQNDSPSQVSEMNEVGSEGDSDTESTDEDDEYDEYGDRYTKEDGELSVSSKSNDEEDTEDDIEVKPDRVSDDGDEEYEYDW